MRLVAMLVLLLVASVPARADEGPSTDDCLACHGIEGFAAPDGRAVAISGDAFGNSSHGTLPCTGCHADATEVPHADRLRVVELDTCAACHDDEVGAYRSGVHGRSHDHGASEAATCKDCHGDIHTVTAHTEPTSAVHWTNLAATCARCHANRDLAEKFHIPVVRPVEAYLESAHARAVARGERAAVCSDCHQAHAILPAADPQSSIWRTNVPQTCGQCHAEILAAFRESVHGEALARGVLAAPVCTDCHGEHRILGHADAASPVFAANIPEETCGRCHGDARLSAKYGLPAEKFSAFQDSFHGLALRAGRVSAANCASCHGVHDIRPSRDPRSHVNPANLAATCGQCHPGAGTRFALGAVHVAANDVKSGAEYWIRFVYLWLIGVVIGSMVAHNAVDLTNKARHPSPLPHEFATHQPVRMSRLLRWQHGLVMVSFPVLVYTGFALTYPESWWATPLLRWEATISLRGTIHRIAAVVLVTAMAWHAGHVLASRRLRACFRRMWPSLADIRYFGAMLAYYAGRRAERPQGGTFSYIEKAEYWAFVWGTVVMTATGLVLWGSNAVLRYLPKWVTDVATAIHFYEAILAALSILVWHMYWVIFDPDVYPMDWSWWNGNAPASRNHERQEQPADTRADADEEPKRD